MNASKPYTTKRHVSPLVTAAISLAVLWVGMSAVVAGGAVGSAGCTPARTAAIADIAKNKTVCMAECSAPLVALPAGDIVKQCGEKCGAPTSDDLRDILDIIAGQKAGARSAGARIPADPDPSAGSGYTPKAAQ